MVRLNIKNNSLTRLGGGYLSNHTITKRDNKYEDILESPSL